MVYLFPLATWVVPAVLCAIPRVSLAAPAPASIDAVLHDDAGVPTVTLVRALAAADAVFDNAGIRLEWLQGDRARCLNALPADAPARQGFLRSLISVRIVGRTVEPDGARPNTLGQAPTGTRVVTIFYGRVEEYARSAGGDAGIVLGHVIAHELGHLLLRRASHSAAGVMRSTLDVTMASQGRLRFTTNEARAMAGYRSLSPPLRECAAGFTAAR